VIVVTALEDLRITRIRERDPGRTDEQIRAIINRQVSDHERLAIADFVIENNGNSALIDQVLALHHKFIS
jgi:dephospho-CoA kinase